MELSDGSFEWRRKGKRLLKPVESEEELEEELANCNEEESKSNYEKKKRSSKNKLKISDERMSKIFCKKERKTVGTGVLGTLVNSIKEDDTQMLERSELESISEEEKQFKASKTKNLIRKRKKKTSESIDVSNLLNSLDNTALKRNSKINKSDRGLDTMFESFSIPSSDTENNSDFQIDHFEKLNTENDEKYENINKHIHEDTSEDDELLNLTEIEKALRKCVKDDYNSSLGLNEWLPTHCIDVRSEIARQMDDDVKIKEITERHEFFYSQWMEQIGYLSSLTKGFTRSVKDCFVREGQVLAISSIKESNPELLLDPDDKILITVQNSDGCVILNRLVNIANSQEKLLIDMNKETEFSRIAENDSKIRLKYGVISLKARTKLWWFCRMAEHCGLVRREGNNIIKYYVEEKCRKKALNSLFSTNADIVSSVDPTMELFNKNGSDSNKDDNSDLSEDQYNDKNDKTEKMTEIDSKWSGLSSIKVSDKARPWERRTKNTEVNHIEIKSPKDEKSTLNCSKKKLFKFMLKNIGPRPIWSSTSIIRDADNSGEFPIEVEPPTNLSLREQGQLKIKWLQMKSQAEKLATHHFKIMDPETKDLDHDSLKYWSKLFKVNLLFPLDETVKIRRVDKSDANNSSMFIENNLAMTEVVVETNDEDKRDDQNSNSVMFFEDINKTKRNSLPLDVEFVSDLSESDPEIIQENDNRYKPEVETTEINQDEMRNDILAESKLADDTNEYHSAEEVFEYELKEKSESDKEECIQESEEDNDSEEENLEIKEKLYKKLKAIRRNRRKFKKKMMEKYGHLFENEAEESDDDGVKILKRGIDGDDSDDDNDDEMDWDELSGFSDFIDDNNYEDGELDGDAIQAHLKHMKQIEEKQYRQLFTLEGIKERKNKVYGFAANQDDGIEGETRLEKKKNEMLFNSAFFDDDVISELWTDEEMDDYDEEIDERNLTEMVGLEYEEWQNSIRNKVNSSDESLNEKRRLNYNILKESLIKEASSSINLLKQRLKSIQYKLNEHDGNSLEDKKELQTKYIEYIEKMKKLLHSIHSACNKCIYENYQFFDHIDIYEYIQKRQEAKKQKKPNIKNTDKLKSKYQSKYFRENINPLNKVINTNSDSEDEIINQKKIHMNGKNIVNIKGGRFMISKK